MSQSRQQLVKEFFPERRFGQAPGVPAFAGPALGAILGCDEKEVGICAVNANEGKRKTRGVGKSVFPARNIPVQEIFLSKHVKGEVWTEQLAHLGLIKGLPVAPAMSPR